MKHAYEKLILLLEGKRQLSFVDRPNKNIGVKETGSACDGGLLTTFGLFKGSEISCSTISF
jgi:hypothetical protein